VEFDLTISLTVRQKSHGLNVSVYAAFSAQLTIEWSNPAGCYAVNEKGASAPFLLVHREAAPSISL